METAQVLYGWCRTNPSLGAKRFLYETLDGKEVWVDAVGASPTRSPFVVPSMCIGPVIKFLRDSERQ